MKPRIGKKHYFPEIQEVIVQSFLIKQQLKEVEERYNQSKQNKYEMDDAKFKIVDSKPFYEILNVRRFYASTTRRRRTERNELLRFFENNPSRNGRSSTEAEMLVSIRKD